MNNTLHPTGNPDYYEIPLQDDDSIDIKRYISLFISNWYWFAISLFISITVAYGLNRYSEKIFSVSSSVLIKDEKIGGGLQMAESFIPGSNIYRNQQNLQNEIGILKSFGLNSRVIESLPEHLITYVGIGRRNIVESRLYKSSCPIMVVSDSLYNQPTGVKIYITIISKEQFSLRINQGYNIEETLKFGQKYCEYGFDFSVYLRDPKGYMPDKYTSGKFYFTFENPKDLANFYSSKLAIEPVDKDASLVRLSVSGPVPEQEADYLNSLMDFYILQGIEVKNRITDSTIIFIEKQILAISSELIKAEDALKKFKQTNKLVSISNEGTLIQNRLIQFGNDKVNLELQKSYFEYLTNYLNAKNESGDIISPSTMGISDSQLNELVQKLANLQAQKKQLSMNLDLNQAPLVLLEEGIKNAKAALDENIKNSLEVVSTGLKGMDNRIANLEVEVSKLPETEIRMIGFEREFNLNNTVYTFLLEKKAEAGIARASNVSDNRIIDRSDPYNASILKPKGRLNYLIALFMGVFVPGFLISLIYFFNNKIIDKEDIISRTKTPIIGYISHSDSFTEIPVNDKPGSVLAESFRSVRTSLRYFIKDEANPVIAVTSTISAEGKTFISINLASVYALLGRKVLLVGLDLRKPRIHKIFDISNSEGMSEYLIGNCDYDKVIKKTQIENLYYAPSGPVPPNPAELIEGVKMKVFIEKARKEFDMIIIDTPPVAIVSDVLLVSDYADVNIFVVRQRYSSKNTLDLIQEFYETGKLKNIGIIINDISLSGYYGYGLRYGYSLGYGYSYGGSYYGEYTNLKYGNSDKNGYYLE